MFRFRWPIDQPYKETSYFWYRGDVGFHDGLDLAPLPGHDMLLRYVSTGRVIREGWHNISGWYVVYEADIWDDRKWIISYNHMAHRSPHRAGDTFDVGQWAGTLGSTGYSTGVHCHFYIQPDYGPPGMKLDPKIGFEQMDLVAKARERGY